MIESAIYTMSTKDKVVNPSQWKDDMYITLKWECPSCGKTYLKCDCEGSRETFKPTLEHDTDEQTRWEEITAINCNPQVDEIGDEDEACPDCGFDPCECDTDDPDYWGE